LSYRPVWMYLRRRPAGAGRVEEASVRRKPRLKGKFRFRRSVAAAPDAGLSLAGAFGKRDIGREERPRS